MKSLLIGCVCILLAGAYGWVMNIVSIVNSDFAHLSGMLVLKVVGIFVVPLGCILGYF